MKRSIIFIAVLISLVTLGGGLGYFQFVVKPGMIKRFILESPRPPASVAVDTPRIETWAPRLPAIGTFRAVQEINIAPQIGGVVVSVRVESGEDVEKGAPLFEIDNSVEQADLKNNLAVLKKPFDNIEVIQLCETLSHKWSLSRRLQAQDQLSPPQQKVAS